MTMLIMIMVVIISNTDDKIKEADLTSNAGGGEGERSGWKKLEQVIFHQ